MNVRLLGLMLCMSCGGQTGENTQGPVTVVAITQPDAGSVETVAPLPEGELGPSIAKLWAGEIAGRKDPALLSRVVATLTRGSERREMGLGEGAFGRFVSEGKLLAIVAKKTLLVADAQTGKIVSVVATDSIDELVAIARSNLFVTTEGTNLVLREAPSGQMLSRMENAGVFTAADDGSIVVSATNDGLSIFDVKTKKAKNVTVGETSAATLVLGDQNRAVTVMTSGSDAYVTYDLATGTELARQQELFDLGPPGFSADKKWIAHAPIVNPNGNDWRPKKINLVDRTTKKVVASSGACPYPTSFDFSPDSKVLVVGDLLRACLFDVPSLRLIAKTPELRKAGTMDDDLQNTTVSFMKDTLFVLSADGTAGLYTTAGKKLWSGRGQVMRLGGEKRIVSDDPTPEVITVEAANKLVRRPMTPDEQERLNMATLGDDVESPPDEKFQLVDPHVCRVGEWMLPAAACE